MSVDEAEAAEFTEYLRALRGETHPTLPAPRKEPAVLTVRGYSDDLIEVEGDISEEFDNPAAAPSLLVFSDGTVARVVYGRGGIWRITLEAKGDADPQIQWCETADEDVETSEDYSDVLTFTGPITWVARAQDVLFRRGRLTPDTT